jgi:hypothetical protein
MKDKDEENIPGPKERYEAPVVTRISLRPEEAVLGHCKNSSASGPVASSCAITSCMNLGS